jgi:serine/threonine protein kinase
MSPADRKASKKTGGRHRLVVEIGRGGMGTVYVALASGPAGFRKLKVVKRLRPQLATDPHFLMSFLDEARLSARLNHPNIVQTLEVGFDGVHYFIEMEYLEGQTYDALVRRASAAGGVPLTHSVWVLKEVLDGLRYAHELRDARRTLLEIVHRDISPHNVFVTYQGAVKILDFGIAKAADSTEETRTGIVKGKPTYMSPEQAARQKVDHRADLFAVGVMLWEALTGERLWGGASDAEILSRLRDGDVPSPGSVKPDVDPTLAAICTRALSVDPAARYATAGAMHDDIEAWLDANGARRTRQALGELVSELFDDRRRAIQSVIASHESALDDSADDRDSEVHTLAEVLPNQGTQSGEMSASRTMPRASLAGPPARSEAGTRRRKRLAWGAAAVAVLAVLAVLGRRQLKPHTSQPTASAGATTDCCRDADCEPLAGVCQAGSCVARSRVECAHNRECGEKLGTSATCNKVTHACVALDSQDCRTIAEPGDAEDDATVWLGTLFATRDASQRAFWQPAENAVDLARRDFVEMLRGFPPGAHSGFRRFALVACDDSVDYRRAADHLVDVGTPAVIGFTRDLELVDLATSRFAPNGVLAMSAANTTAVLSDLGDRDGSRMVWRTVVSVAQWGQPMAAMVADHFEPTIRRTSALRSRVPMRVALVRRADASALAFGDALLSHLTLNGRPAAQNEHDLRQILLAGPSSVSDAATALVDFAPHLLVLFDRWDVLLPLIRELERRWPATEPSRPTYFVPWMLASRDLFDFIGDDAQRRKRFFGLSTPANTQTNGKFVLRYNEVFAEHTTLATSPSTAYDAAYLLAYAASAIPGDEDVTGAGLAKRLATFGVEGPSIEVGPGSIAAGVRAAQTQRGLHLLGATSDLALDPRAGEIGADEVLMCVAVDEKGRAFDGRESGLRWDARAKRLGGKFDCF